MLVFAAQDEQSRLKLRDHVSIAVTKLDFIGVTIGVSVSVGIVISADIPVAVDVINGIAGLQGPLRTPLLQDDMGISGQIRAIYRYREKRRVRDGRSKIDLNKEFTKAYAKEMDVLQSKSTSPSTLTLYHGQYSSADQATSACMPRMIR